MSFEPVESRYKAGQPWVGATQSIFQAPQDFAYNEPRTYTPQWGWLLALNPFTNKVKWYNKEKYLTTSGILATSGNLVFYNAGDRWFKAIDAESGKDLWKFQTGSPIVGNPFSYSHKGKQFVGVMAGIGGTYAGGLWGSNDWWGEPVKVACTPGGYPNHIESDYIAYEICGYRHGGLTGAGHLHIFSL